jgi:hypothetical protein
MQCKTYPNPSFGYLGLIPSIKRGIWAVLAIKQKAKNFAALE